MVAGRPRIYKDDVLKTKPIRISEKYELEYIMTFIYILRKFRKKAIDFVMKYSNKEEQNAKN